MHFECLLPHNRPTGFQKPASRIRVNGYCCNTTGFPVNSIRQAVFALIVLGFISGKPDHKSGKPFSAFKFLPKNRIFRFFCFACQPASRLWIVSLCPITGKPVMKSGKPDSWFIFAVHLLPPSFGKPFLVLSLKAIYSSLDFTPKSIFFFHFHIKLSQENHSPSLHSLKTIFKLHFQHPKL